jgi:hypothetical protein
MEVGVKMSGPATQRLRAPRVHAVSASLREAARQKRGGSGAVSISPLHPPCEPPLGSAGPL